MAERKVIQISFAVYQGCGLVALCDDGTIWMNERPHDPNGKLNCEWFQVRPVPGTPAQPGEKEG